MKIFRDTSRWQQSIRLDPPSVNVKEITICPLLILYSGFLCFTLMVSFLGTSFPEWVSRLLSVCSSNLFVWLWLSVAHRREVTPGSSVNRSKVQFAAHYDAHFWSNISSLVVVPVLPPAPGSVVLSFSHIGASALSSLAYQMSVTIDWRWFPYDHADIWRRDVILDWNVRGRMCC